MNQPTDEVADAVVRREELAELFRSSEKPKEAFRIGGEAEKFGVDRASGAPLAYDGPRGIRRVFDALVRDHGWSEVREREDGPVIALSRGDANITLEPGAQLELSGAPHVDVHAVQAEMRDHLDELAAVSREMNIVWLGVGFHPTARPSELPWVPKERYGVMKRYLPTQGVRARDMMQRTATIQANFDYSSEADAMHKLVVLLKLSPLIAAMTANAPFIEGKLSARRSERGDVWLHMDPSRSGLIPRLWTEANPTYESYVEWALDAGMFLFRRGDEFIANTGQSFRSFLDDGFEGHRPTWADWVSHVNSLFPEARLKRTIEARSCDALPERLAGSVPALLTGLLYDADALDGARALGEELTYEAVSSARPELVELGLKGRIGDQSVHALAERLLDLAEGGLRRRGRPDASGRDESLHLDGLRALVDRRMTPADALVEGLAPDQPIPVAELIRRTAIS
jgi:glutamate--cysteine ligase